MATPSSEPHHLVAASEAATILLERGETIATAESLTGGLVSARLVETPGISAVLRGGVVSYTNEIKAGVLGVDREVLDTVGPVSSQVAVQMASGVANLTGAEHAVSTTGVAGPGPSDGHPAGTVWIGREDGKATQFLFPGDRGDIRSYSASCAIILLAGLELPAELAQYQRLTQSWK